MHPHGLKAYLSKFTGIGVVQIADAPHDFPAPFPDVFPDKLREHGVRKTVDDQGQYQKGKADKKRVGQAEAFF
jgi:hypothetical protein